MILPRRKDDRDEAVVHDGIVLRLPSLGDGVARSEALPIGGVVGIGVYDWETPSPDLGFPGEPHGPTVRYDVHQGVEGCFGRLVECGLVTVGPRVNGLEGGLADFAEQATGQEIALTSHPSGQVGIQVIVVEACEDVLHGVRTTCCCSMAMLTPWILCVRAGGCRFDGFIR